jgi:hypothetical protein
MIFIAMPGGAIRETDEADILWLRKAFDSEWKGTTMLQLADDRIYSIESVDNLWDKFSNAKLALGEFSAPDTNKLKIIVSTKRVRRVIESNPAIYHEKAKSLLIFGPKLRLAVRESPDEVRQRLQEAEMEVA